MVLPSLFRGHSSKAFKVLSEMALTGKPTCRAMSVSISPVPLAVKSHVVEVFPRYRLNNSEVTFAQKYRMGFSC